MRAILDANILFSALLSPLGAPAKILEAWERKLFTLVACEELVSELRDVSGRPFFRAKLRADVAEVLAISIQDLSFYCKDLASGSVASDLKDSYLSTGARRGRPCRIPRDRRQGVARARQAQNYAHRFRARIRRYVRSWHQSMTRPEGGFRSTRMSPTPSSPPRYTKLTGR